MKISENWLRERVALDDIITEQLVEALTMAGLEVDTTENAGEDVVIDIDLTPNRGDCLGMNGIAREVAAIYARETKPEEPLQITQKAKDVFPVSVEQADACPRYTGRVIKGINISKPTPDWMRDRLEKSGIRSIDAVVDVTNYVLLETGQPLHAFDLGQLSERIEVRMAKEGESLTLLNDETVALRADSLIIADAKGPLALAGIMGGATSAVSTSTKNLFLESAHFAPLAIAGQARSYGLSTDSSHRFERGVDPQSPQVALDRATSLLLEIVGGEAGPVIDVTTEEHLPQREAVRVRLPRLRRLLEIEDSSSSLMSIFARLGMACTEQADEEIQVTPPSWRFDITREEDLVEEVARIKGYNEVGVSLPEGSRAALPAPEGLVATGRIRDTLAGRGYREAITFSFVSPQVQSLLNPDTPAVPLANALSEDLSVMRLDLWSGLLGVLQTHQSRQASRTRLFETGLCFLPGEPLPDQPERLGLLVAGERTPVNWASPAQDSVDFYDLKGDLEGLFRMSGRAQDFSFTPGEHPGLHPGQTARILDGDVAIGWLGTLHPAVQEALDVSGQVVLAELDLNALTRARIPAYRPISRQPVVRRDLAVVVDEATNIGPMLDSIRKQAGETLRDLTVFDIYAGKGIEKERKSIAFTLTFQHPSHTLSEDDIKLAMDGILKMLQSEYGASLRA